MSADDYDAMNVDLRHMIIVVTCYFCCSDDDDDDDRYDDNYNNVIDCDCWCDTDNDLLSKQD